MSASQPPVGGALGPGRCGMCGTCGSMPPWAPEALRNATPAARRALFERMKEKQRRFIVARDARLAAMNIDGDASTAKEDMKSQWESTGPRQDNERSKQPADDTESTELGGKNDRDPGMYADSEEMPLPPADEIPLHTTEEQNHSEVHPNSFETSKAALALPVQMDSPQSLSEIPTNNLDSTVSPKRKSSRRAVVIDPNPERTAQRANNPSMSSLSMRSNDSDVDSFHTAEEVDAPASEAGEEDEEELDEIQIDDDELEEVPMGGGDLGDDNDEFADWQAFEAGKPTREDEMNESDVGAGTREVVVERDDKETKEIELKGGDPNDSGDPSRDSSSNHIPTMTMLQLSPGKTLTSIPSENLEEAVSARRPLARGHSRQGSSSQFEEYALPSDLVPLQSADAVSPLSCQDCERWRGRVEELQLKVETLTSSLAARDMECASLRAQCSGRIRSPNRNESRLIQECESLRVTTEFLYQKLERYERKAHISHGDIH